MRDPAWTGASMPAAPYRLRANTRDALIGGLAAGLLNLARTFWLARALPPAEFGSWSLLQLVLAYAGCCHFGVAVAMPNLLAASQAMDDLHGSRELARGGLFLILGLAAAVAAAILALPRRIIGETVADYRLLFACTFLAQQLFLWAGALLRGLLAFQRIAVAQIVSGAGALVLMIFLIPAMGVRGALAAMLAGYLGGAGLGAAALRRQGFGPVPRSVFKALLLAGFPLLVTFFVGTGLQNIDRVVVGKMLGHGPLGYYSVSNVFVLPVMFLPSVLGGLLMTHFSRAAAIANEQAIRTDLLRFSWALGIALAVVTACIFTASGGIVRQFIPGYLASLPTVRILLAGSYFYGSNLVLASFLIAFRREVGLVCVQGGSLALLAGLCLLSIRAGRGLEGVGLANLLAYLSYFSGLVLFARRAMGWDWAFARRLGAACLGPFAYMATVLVLCRPLEQLWAGRGIFQWACLLHLGVTTFAGLPLVVLTLRFAPWQASTRARG